MFVPFSTLNTQDEAAPQNGQMLQHLEIQMSMHRNLTISLSRQSIAEDTWQTEAKAVHLTCHVLHFVIHLDQLGSPLHDRQKLKVSPKPPTIFHQGDMRSINMQARKAPTAHT